MFFWYLFFKMMNENAEIANRSWALDLLEGVYDYSIAANLSKKNQDSWFRLMLWTKYRNHEVDKVTETAMNLENAEAAKALFEKIAPITAKGDAEIKEDIDQLRKGFPNW